MTGIEDRYLSEREIVALLGVGRSTFREWLAKGWFPRPAKLSPGPRGRIGWRASTVRAWMDERPEAELRQTG
jgi:predicted DNA-binding transcriptional regulator AlpA